MRLGFWEIVVVLVVALILFGPNRLPEMGKSLGKAIREFRQATSDLGNELSQAQQALDMDAPKAKPPKMAPQPAADDAETEADKPEEASSRPDDQAAEPQTAEQDDEQRREPV